MKICLEYSAPYQVPDFTCPECNFSPVTINGFPAFSPGLSEKGKFFDSKDYLTLFENESGHFWFENRNKVVQLALKRFFPRAQSLCEIGCGTGFVLKGIAKSHPHLKLNGCDIYPEALMFAKKRVPQANLFQADVRDLPFEEEFDVIGAFDVLEHIQEDERVLLQMFEALKKGGGIIVTVPQHPFLWSRVDEYFFHKRRYTREGLVQKFKKTGFKEIWCTSFVFLLLPLMLLSRVRKKVQKKELDLLNEIKISESLNKVLSRIMEVEYLGVRAGFSLPIGGSLLMVGKKQ